MRTINPKTLNIILSSTVVVALIGVLIFSAFSFMPYPILKHSLDFLASDGNLESFTPQLAAVFRIPAVVGFLLSIFSASFVLYFKGRARSMVNGAVDSAQRFFRNRNREGQEIWKALVTFETDRKTVLLLGVIITLAVLIRLPYLWKPMGHDEAYTFIAFASRGLRVSMTDYHLPNNHVFHTILVFLSTRLFGDSPSAVRLPAFLASVLIIPAVYIAAKVFYNKATGLISTSILASLPVMVDYSTNARGYPLIALFMLLLLVCAAYVKENKNLTAWFILVSISTLGVYTNPTMIYPIGIAFCWLLISAGFNQINLEYGRKIYLYLGISAFSIGIFSLILYTPILVYSGYQSLAGNNFIASLKWTDFVESIPVRIRNTWGEWVQEVPGFGGLIGLIGLVTSIVVPVANGTRWLPLFPAAVVAIGSLLLLQRVAPWPRVWLFLLPLIVMWIVAGFMGLLNLIRRWLPGVQYVIAGITLMGIVLPLGASSVRSYSYYSIKWNTMGEVEEAAVFLSEILVPGDVIVVTSPDTVILDYYLRRRGIDREYLDLNDQIDFRRAIVYVNQGYGQNLESVLIERSFAENVDVKRGEVIYQANRITLYSIPGG